MTPALQAPLAASVAACLVRLFALLQSRSLSIKPPSPHPPPQTTLPRPVTPLSVKTHSSPPSAMTQPSKALVRTAGRDNGVLSNGGLRRESTGYKYCRPRVNNIYVALFGNKDSFEDVDTCLF